MGSKRRVNIQYVRQLNEDSIEARLEKYLKDNKVTRYPKGELIIEALLAFYLPLVQEYEGETQEKLRQSLIDVNYLWQLHYRYLQRRLGIDLDSELATVAPIPIYPVEEQEHKATKKLVSSKRKLELVKERKVLEDEEEGEYPDCFKD